MNNFNLIFNIIFEDELCKLPTQVVSGRDFDKGLEKVKATAVGTMEKFKSWEKEFGSF